jgi:hypothetical protein
LDFRILFPAIVIIPCQKVSMAEVGSYCTRLGRKASQVQSFVPVLEDPHSLAAIEGEEGGGEDRLDR